MSSISVASSLLCGIVVVVAGLVVAVTVKQVFFSSWRGSLAITTVVSVWLCWALALGQLLGSVGLIRRVALLTGALLSAAAAIGLRRVADRHGRGRPTSPEVGESIKPPTLGTWEERALTGGTVLLVSFVAAIWTARTVIALHRGINDPDSVGYHLPFIVAFAHSGYADQHRLLIPLLPVQFFPANDELLSALALSLTDSLAFAAIKNLLFGAFVLVAAHALGKAFGAGRLTVGAAAIALGFPVFAFSQPGEAVNDALLLLLFVAGLAVLAHARARPAPYVLVLACAGLALGVKFSGIVPAAALATLTVILLLARIPNHRWRWSGIGLLVSAALGGSWYLRNAIDYGNPIPPVHLALGPLHLRTVHGVDAAVAYSVAHYAFRGRLLGGFARGLLEGLGPLFAVTAVLCLLGTVACIRSGNRFRLGLIAVAATSFLGYLITPAGAYGPPSSAIGAFVINLHYAIPALVAGAMAGAIALARWRWAWTLPATGLVAIFTSISRGQEITFWAPELGGPWFALLLVAMILGGALAFAWFRQSLRKSARPWAVATIATLVIALALIAGRYPSRSSTDPVAKWAASVHNARIGEWTADVSDLYGPREQNRVTIISQLRDGAAIPLDTCLGWKRALRDGHYGYAAAIADTAWSRWLEADPAFRLVANELAGATNEDAARLHRYNTLVFQIVGDPDVSCPGRVDIPGPSG